MAIKTVLKNTSTNNASEIKLFEVPNGKSIVVLSIELYGGGSSSNESSSKGGIVTFIKKKGNDTFTWQVSVSAFEYLVIDTKQFYESGMSLFYKANVGRNSNKCFI